MTVRIVTDSTADLPADMTAALGITVVPLTVHMGGQDLRDGVDITPVEFFRRLPQQSALPKTSQPSAGAFAGVYARLTQEGHDVVSVHISEKLSGTMNSARQAAQQTPGARVEVIDARGASLWTGLVVLEAARAAQRGATTEEVVRIAREAADNMRLYFVLDTLDYLQKGGRVGKAAAVIGGLLSIKPVLTIRDGEVHAHERIRTRAKALERIRELAREGGPYAEIAVLHATTPEDQQALVRDLQPLTAAPVISGSVGPVIGVYTGPGVVGVALRK